MTTRDGADTATVGRYTIVRELGQGGMATVYLARQQDLERLVALKELGVLRALDDDLAQRFLREARIAGGLSHPNIVTVYDYFEHGGTPFIAMEYVDGGSLRPHVQSGLTTAQIGGVLEGLLAGLAHAEQLGIVHRDIKPENVLITGAGQVKITDFGIAKASDQVLTRASLTATGMTMGTPAYMAPEQALGREVGPQTDLYAVGVIAYELLAGRTPFADTETPVGILMRNVNETVAPVRALRPDVDPQLSHWIDRMLAKQPSDRPPSAGAALEELDEILDGMLGARWRPDARLPAVAGAAVAAGWRTPSTPRVGATVPWPPDGDRTAAPRGPAEIWAPTVADDDPPRLHRRPRAAMALLGVVAVAAVAAAALGGAGGPPASGGGAPPPAANEASGPPLKPASETTAPAAAPAAPPPPPAAAVAPPPAPAPVAAPPPAAPLTGENADDGGDGAGSGGGGTGENADDGGDGP